MIQFVLFMYQNCEEVEVCHHQLCSLLCFCACLWHLLLDAQDPPGCLYQFPISLLPGLTQLPMLQIGNYQHSSTVIHSESIHILHYMCLTKHPLWVLLLFIIVFIKYL